jgi:hypothetical protein
MIGRAMRDSNRQLQSEILLTIHNATQESKKEIEALRKELEKSKKVESFAQYSALNNAVANSLTRSLPQVGRQRFLNALDFARINDRYDKIEVAHRETLKWFLSSGQQSQLTWPCFPRWLEMKGDPNNVYWVGGK